MVSERLARIRAMSGEELLRPVNMFGAFEMPAVQFVSLAIGHSVHHRGQLSAYLRAAGQGAVDLRPERRYGDGWRGIEQFA